MSKENKKKAIKWFIEEIVAELAEGNSNIQMYRDVFDSMTEKEMDKLAQRCKDRTLVLPYYCPNLHEDVKINDIFKVADSIGLEFFKHLIMTDTVSGVRYKSKYPYMILRSVVRRQSNHMVFAKSVHGDGVGTDAITGQVLTADKTSKLTLPEVAGLTLAGNEEVVYEYINVRGGNVEALNQMKQRLLNDGEYTLKEAKALNTLPESVLAFKYYLAGMHLDINI